MHDHAFASHKASAPFWNGLPVLSRSMQLCLLCNLCMAFLPARSLAAAVPRKKVSHAYRWLCTARDRLGRRRERRAVERLAGTHDNCWKLRQTFPPPRKRANGTPRGCVDRPEMKRSHPPTTALMIEHVWVVPEPAVCGRGLLW